MWWDEPAVGVSLFLEEPTEEGQGENWPLFCMISQMLTDQPPLETNMNVFGSKNNVLYDTILERISR